MIKGEWVIEDMLRAMLPYVEHYYHTHEDPGYKWWKLVLAIRDLIGE